jgi:hypothetical protein
MSSDRTGREQIMDWMESEGFDLLHSGDLDRWQFQTHLRVCRAPGPDQEDPDGWAVLSPVDFRSGNWFTLAWISDMVPPDAAIRIIELLGEVA